MQKKKIKTSLYSRTSSTIVLVLDFANTFIVDASIVSLFVYVIYYLATK